MTLDESELEKLKKLYQEHTALSNGFILKYDLEFIKTIYNYLENNDYTINIFFNNIKDRGLIDTNITIDKIFDTSQGDNIFTNIEKNCILNSIKQISFKHFLIEGFTQKTRLFSAFERGDRKCMTKTRKGDNEETWKPGIALINQDYLDDIEKNKERKHENI